MQKSLKGNFMELTKKQKVIFNIVETSTSDTNSFAESTNSFLLL